MRNFEEWINQFKFSISGYDYYVDFKNDGVVSKEDDMVYEDFYVNLGEEEKIKRLLKNGFKYDENSGVYILNKNKIDYMYSYNLIQIINKQIK